MRTPVSRARRVGRAVLRQGVAAVEAVRHFLGFADDSDARVGRSACWRRLAMVGELPQKMSAPLNAVAAPAAAARAVVVNLRGHSDE